MGKPQTEQNNDNVRYIDEHCSCYILRLLKEINQAATYRDFGTKFPYGTLRNIASTLAKKGVITRLPNEYIARFILPEWTKRFEYYCAIKNNSRGRVAKFDFLSYLQSLGWDSVLCVHDLKLCLSVFHLNWVNKQSKNWTYCKENHSYRCTLNLSYPVKVVCYNTGVILVNIECSAKPFPLDSDGLASLLSLLGEIKASLNASNIPDPLTWAVVQWHLNKDSEKISEGSCPHAMHFTFKDFFNDAAQFYYKPEIGKYRAETIQNPDMSIKQVFEEVLNRDSFLGKKSTANWKDSLR
jgi:hypothetical protein